MKKFTVFILLITASIFLLLSCSLPEQPIDLVINEVVSSNSKSLKVAELGSPDWIEFYNPTDATLELEGYTLKMVKGSSTKSYTFSNYSANPDSYIVVCATDSTEQDSRYLTIGFNLPKDGFSLFLFNANQKLVSQIVVSSLPVDVSYARVDSGEYKFCTSPTPSEKNSGNFFDSVEDIANSQNRDIVISEATRDWVEIYNTSDNTINLNRFYLSDNENNPTKWQMPNYSLKPNEFLLISLGVDDDDCEYTTSFKISKEENLYLSTVHGITQTIEFFDLIEVSVGLNEFFETEYYLFPTKGEKNSGATLKSTEISDMQISNSVIVNEIQLKNATTLIDDDGDRPAWIELYNSSENEIDLSTFSLSDDIYELDKWKFTNAIIKPNEYLLVYLSDKDKHLHTDFKVSKGETLYFTDLENLLVQEVFFADECRLNDISFGIKEGKWLYFGKATPGQENYTKGFESITNVEKLNANGVWISEVSAASPARSDELDWVELYNDSENDVELSNFYLSNDLDNPKLFQLSGVMDAKSYKVFYASKDSTEQTATVLPFSISLSGERLLLSNKSGYGCDYFETGALRLNVTSGRALNDYSGERVFFTTPTKSKPNASGVTGFSPNPIFSVSGGFYSDSVTVEISCADPYSKIYYTTNGSAPTKEATLYTAPITISSTTVLSAISYSEGKIKSEKTVATYLIEEPHSLPVVSLSMNKNDFKQIYAVIDKSGPIVERECYIEYFDKDGSLGTSFPAGVRVAGNSTRKYPQKSLGLYLRGAYGRSSVTYPFFDDYAITNFSSLVLRNAGQNLSDSRIADAYCSMLMKGMNVDYAETRFVVVYINGSYYGIYDLKENQNEDFYASRFGINRSTMNVIRRNLGVLAGSNSQIKEIYRMAQSLDLSKQSNYDKFCEFVDSDAFIDYIIAQSYIGNADMFNQKFVNTRDYKLKWRPVFYDLDYGMHNAGTNILGKFFTGAGVPSPDQSLTNMYIPTALRMNEGWRNKFVERYAECINEHFANAGDILEEMIIELEPEMERHIARWGKPSSYAAWQGHIEKIRSIVEQRPEIMKKQLQREFSLSDAKMAALFG